MYPVTALRVRVLSHQLGEPIGHSLPVIRFEPCFGVCLCPSGAIAVIICNSSV